MEPRRVNRCHNGGIATTFDANARRTKGGADKVVTMRDVRAARLEERQARGGAERPEWKVKAEHFRIASEVEVTGGVERTRRERAQAGGEKRCEM